MEGPVQADSNSDRGSSENSLDEVLTFSPDLGLSPIMSLSRNMGHLSCRDRVTPRRRLKMSPDSLTPSPSDSSWKPAAAEAPSLTGSAGKSTTISKNRTRKSSKRRPSESSISKPVEESIQQMKESDIEDENLIGDFSKHAYFLIATLFVFIQPYCLPVEAGKHQDLKYISSETAALLLRGKYSKVVEEYVLVDCRYPYEYTGGHIKGALNLYREEHLLKTFLHDPQSRLSVQRRIILIFHCEFSSERGPKLCRTLRKLDRNANPYPTLCYPELYILKGGYKDFYGKFQELCEPQAYVHMLHTDFREEMRNFHRKNNPWTARRTRKELFKPQN